MFMQLSVKDRINEISNKSTNLMNIELAKTNNYNKVLSYIKDIERHDEKLLDIDILNITKKYEVELNKKVEYLIQEIKKNIKYADNKIKANENKKDFNDSLIMLLKFSGTVIGIGLALYLLIRLFLAYFLNR